MHTGAIRIVIRGEIMRTKRLMLSKYFKECFLIFILDFTPLIVVWTEMIAIATA